VIFQESGGNFGAEYTLYIQRRVSIVSLYLSNHQGNYSPVFRPELAHLIFRSLLNKETVFATTVRGRTDVEILRW